MKKTNRKLFSVLTLLTILSVILLGCVKTTTTTFTKEENGVTLELVYTAKGDKVTVQTAKNHMPYSAIQATTKEEAKAILEPISKQYQNVEGLKESIKYYDDYAEETLTIDYTKVDFDEIQKIQGITLSGDAKKKGVSLKKSTELLEKQGYEKTK